MTLGFIVDSKSDVTSDLEMEGVFDVVLKERVVYADPDDDYR